MVFARIRAPVGYLVVYVAAVALGRMAVLNSTGLALFWPAAGVAALWMLRGTSRRQVVLDAVLLGGSTTVVFSLFGKQPGVCLLFGAVNLVQGFTVRAISARLQRLPLTGPLTPGVTKTRDLLELSMASTVAAFCSAPFGLAAASLMNAHLTWMTVVGWVVRYACGTFVVAAVALTIMAARRERPSWQQGALLTGEPRPYAVLELVAATLVTMFAGFLVFSAPDQLPIAYVMIATSAWIGFRFAPVVGAVYSLFFGTLALVLTLVGWGPFGAIPELGSRAIVVQFFVTVTAMIVLMLAFGVHERMALTTRLRFSEAKASERADLVDAVTSVMTDGLVVIDARGQILLSNPAAQRLAGASDFASRVSSRTQGYFRLDGNPLLASELPHARALRGETVPPTDLLRIDPQTGLQTIVSISAAPLHPPTSDEAAVAVLVLHDVTKERAQQRELENFGGVVAHDLKNPLTGVISWAEILDEQLNETSVVGDHDLRASLQRIRTSADRMARLISDLLAYSQAQNAGLSLQPVFLDEMVDQIARDLLDTHRQEIPLVEHSPLGVVLADRTLVRQLLTNVIGNAVKYVAPGVVPRIVIGSAPVEGMLEIWVSDNGIGIPDKDLGRVFDSFFRASSTRDYPGTGLGLAICARTVERHGGRISAREGIGGVGTTLIFTMPLGPEQTLAPTAEPDLEPASATS